MNRAIPLILLTVAMLTSAPNIQANEQNCLAYVSTNEGYKTAHQNEDCMSAAAAGFGSAQYAVGMSFGFSGQQNREEEYYLKAAENRTIAAYLALGHFYKEGDPKKSIYWYQRFAETQADGYGYAAKLISTHMEEQGNVKEANHWKSICEQSPYNDC